MRLLLLLIGLLPAAVAAQTPEQCSQQFPRGAARARCVTPWLDDIVMRRGAGDALQAAEGLVKRGVMNVNDCHVMGHAVGHASWRKERDLGKAFPATTAIRVKDAIDAFNAIFWRIMVAVRAAGSVTLVAGALVLAGAMATAQRRTTGPFITNKACGATVVVARRPIPWFASGASKSCSRRAAT